MSAQYPDVTRNADGIQTVGVLTVAEARALLDLFAPYWQRFQHLCIETTRLEDGRRKNVNQTGQFVRVDKKTGAVCHAQCNHWEMPVDWERLFIIFVCEVL